MDKTLDLLQKREESVKKLLDEVKSQIEWDKANGLLVGSGLDQMRVTAENELNEMADVAKNLTKKKKEEEEQKWKLLKKDLTEKYGLTAAAADCHIQQMKQESGSSAAPAADPPVSVTAASGDAPTAGPSGRSSGRFFSKKTMPETPADKKRKGPEKENAAAAAAAAKRGRPAKPVVGRKKETPAKKAATADSGSETEEETDVRLNRGIIKSPAGKGDDSDYEWF